MRIRPVRLLPAAISCLAMLAAHAGTALAGPGGQLRIEVVDRDTLQPLACRMHLTNAAKRPLKAPKVPFWHDHFVFSGSITLKLPKGEYAFEVERGPEYLVRTGHFTMDDFSDDTKTVDLKRFVDMAGEGWWSGDLDVERPAKDLELLMEAEDLHVAELISWPNQKNLLPRTSVSNNPLVRFDENRYYHLAGGTDARAGGTLLFFNLPKPLDLAGFKPEFPPQQDSIRSAKSQGNVWVDAQKAFGWDVPVWVASGQLDSVQLANSNLGRRSAVSNEAGGKPRDKFYYPDPTGNGRWSEKIYYHLLNCGLRLPPTAGSGSGAVANPVGYDRMYVHVDGEFTYEKWWEALRAGRVVVTNGPLIRPNVEGEMPGHVFRADAGQEIDLEVGLTLSTRDRVAYLEIIKNGELAHQVRLDDWAKMGGKLPPLSFKESGWFVIRAVTDVPNTYRFATTGPYYVEIGDQPRISKSSAQFFLDWVKERMKNLKLDDDDEREVVLKCHRQAREYWQGLVEKANAK
ncbi:MAG: CehA/McbA family metallohydrolase [Planctomycetia bacterium]|nr:CehA/McbA family metallohydrolase [Planctomycetia bacterium]